MAQFNFELSLIIVIVFLLIRTVGVLSKDLNEKERTARASFIQKLLNTQKNLEGRIRLVGGRNKFEGNCYFFSFTL